MSALSRNLLWLAGLAILLAIVYYFSDIVTYILIAWVLSMLGRPLMYFFRKHLRLGRLRLGKAGAALLTIVTFYLVLAGILWLFVPTVVQQARNLGAVDYASLGEKLRQSFSWVDLQLHDYGLLAPGESLAVRTQETLNAWFRPALVGNWLGSFLSTAGNVLLTFSVVTFILFFFLKDHGLFTDILHAVVPNELEPKVQQAVDRSSAVLTRYFGGLVVQIVAFALLITVFLWVLGVRNAMLIGAFGGIFNVIPYVGPILGALFGWFITISSNLGADSSALWPLFVKIGLTFVVVHFIDSMILSLIIFSKSVQAHPLEIFIVTLVAAKVGGVVGMVIGIPVYTVLRVVARVFFSEFKVVQRLTDHLDE
jgi:predicted PurR-regulated permease PerM